MFIKVTKFGADSQLCQGSERFMSLCRSYLSSAAQTIFLCHFVAFRFESLWLNNS